MEKRARKQAKGRGQEVESSEHGRWCSESRRTKRYVFICLELHENTGEVRLVGWFLDEGDREDMLY
jgi:hypothetical protein